MRLLLLAVLIAAPAVAAPQPAPASITVLGLPLGGAWTPPRRECSIAEIGEEVRSACWVGRPFRDRRYGVSGSVSLPGRDKLPAWAAGGLFHVSVDPQGLLDQVRVQTVRASGDAAVASIASRFGAPVDVADRGAASYTARWTADARLIVKMVCDREWCNVEFRSAAAEARRLREVAQRAAKDQARPVTP